jgi:hypothetical protein
VESTLFGWWKIKKKDENLGDSAQGQADPRSVAVYTMDRPGRVNSMYICVGTVLYPVKLTDQLVVAPGTLTFYG